MVPLQGYAFATSPQDAQYGFWGEGVHTVT